VKLKLLLAVVVSASVCGVSTSTAVAYPVDLWTPTAGAQTTADSESGNFPLVSSVESGCWPGKGCPSSLRIVIDDFGSTTDYEQVGSDCGNTGVATFTIRGKGVRKTSFKSAPGCRFKGGVRKLPGGIRLKLPLNDAKDDGSSATLTLLGTSPRKVRRVLYWTMHLSSKAGWELLNPKIGETCYGTIVTICDDDLLGDLVYLPYGGSDYTQSGTVTFARTYYPRVKARRIWQSNFDAYFNICINNNRKVRAKGGQLYCWATVGRRAYWNTTMSHKDDL